MSYYSTIDSYIAAVADGKIAEVALSNRQLDDAACKALADALRQSTAAKVVDLQSNGITSTGARYLCDALRTNTSVVEIHLDSNVIDDTGAELFLEVLQVNTSVRAVNLQNNKISPAMIEKVRFAAQLNTQPMELKRAVPAMLQNDPSVTTLNLSGCTGVNLPLLKTVMCGCTTITSLDLSRVGVLDVGCGFAAEILAGCSASLAYLDLSGNGITVHGIKSLAEGLKASKSLKTLLLRSNKIGDDSAAMLVSAFKVNDSVTSCDVGDNAVSMSAGDSLQHWIELNKQPIELKRAYHAASLNDINCPKIEFAWIPNMSQAAYFLSLVLKQNTVVKLLNLSNARIGDLGAQYLAPVLRQNRFLTTLHLANNDITSTGAGPLAQALASNTTLTELNLANNRIDDAGAIEFQVMLQVNGTLSLLNLELNEAITPSLMNVVDGLVTVNQQPRAMKQILPLIEANSDKVTVVDMSQYDGVQYHTDASVAVLCRALVGNTFVRQVDLSFNCIGDAGAIHFAELLVLTETLEELNIAECSVGDRGGCALGRALLRNKSLQELNLEGNCIGDETADVFLQTLVTNHYLTSLNVSRTRVTPVPTNDLRLACAVNLQPESLKLALPALRSKDPSLTVLDLTVFDGRRRYSDTAVTILCFELQGNENITTLKLDNNAFSHDGVAQIAELLAKPWCRIATLTLSNNAFDDQDADTLANAFAQNGSLVTVDLLGTKIGAKGIQAFTAALEHNHTIKTLDVPTVKGDLGTMSALRRMLVVNTQPLALKLVLPRILKNDPSLRSVELRGVGAVSLFGDTSAQLLALALTKTTTVTSVDISDNDVSSLGAEYLTDMLEDNRSIIWLNLSSNRIDDHGGSLFVKVIGVNDTLRMVDLANNPISQECAGELDYVLRINNGPLALKHAMLRLAANDPDLTVLDFAGPAEEQLQPVVQAITDGGRNKGVSSSAASPVRAPHGNTMALIIKASPTKGASQQQLTPVRTNATEGRYFTDEYVHVLCSLLVDNTNVTTLYLEGNQIGDRGAQLLADTLRVNTTLTAIALDRNYIGAEGAHALFLALKTNHTLTNLSLSGNPHIPSPIFELINTPLVINRQPLRQPVRPKGAFKQRPDVAMLSDEQQFRDLDYLRDVEDQIFEDAMRDCPDKYHPSPRKGQ